MSQSHVERVIGLLATDEALRRRFEDLDDRNQSRILAQLFMNLGQGSRITAVAQHAWGAAAAEIATGRGLSFLVKAGLAAWRITPSQRS